MATPTMQIMQWAGGIVAAILMAVGAYLAPAKLKAKILKWWPLAVLVVLAWLFLGYLPSRYPPSAFPSSSALPESFRANYWRWMFLFVAGTFGAGLMVWRQIQAASRPAGAADDAGAFPDLDAAWEEILVRLDSAKIDPAAQRFYLLLTPSEESAQALIDSAGLQVFAQAPASQAPIHAYATGDGVYLSLGGASSLGAPNDPKAGARLESLCARLVALRPDCPVVRGVVVLLPIEWCSRTESVKEAASIRDDLQAILRVTGVRLPTFALFPGMETVPGLPEFAARLVSQISPQMADQRVGFAIPRNYEFSGDLVQRGLTWQSGWFHVWVLNLLSREPMNYRGNADLVMLDAEFRRYRKRLRSILESAFSTHQESSPILFRGCYFAATGERRGERAFSAGLFRGARSRVVADHLASTWTADADRDDRRYRRIALAIGAIGLLVCLYFWSFISSRSPALGWGGMIGLAILWVAGLFVLLRRR